MHSRTIVLAVGLLAAPLSMLTVPSASLSQSTGGSALWAAAAPIQDSVNGRALEPAPVPSIGPVGLSPADRVAGPGSRALEAGPLNSTPFSSTPSGTLSEGGDQASQSDRTLAPSDSSGVTPNLGR